MDARIILLAAALITGAATAQSQIVTTSPAPLQQSSTNVVLTYRSDLGNGQLANLPTSAQVYAHIGVITNKSDGQWAYAPSWGDNNAKYRLSRTATNTWQLSIGNINTYFGITDPTTVVEKLVMVFRTADNSLEGKTATGGDIYVDVHPEGFAMTFTDDAPFVLDASTATVTFNVSTTELSDISLHFGSVDSPAFAEATNATNLVANKTILSNTDNIVIAKAVNNKNESITKSIYICYPLASKTVSSSTIPPLGATRNDDGTVTFCIAAPMKENAMIIGSWTDYKPSCRGVMDKIISEDGIPYFTTTVSGLEECTDYPYYYLIDNVIKVGDPYARLVLDPYNDRYLEDGTYPGLMPYPHQQVGDNVMLAVYRSDRDDYDWQVTDFVGPDQTDLIIYEMLLRDFTGTEGVAYGNGNLAQAMLKIDYLKTLGVNAIELMPIQEFNGNNSWGYNTNFYFAPDKAYGSPDDYRAFIDLCHQNGMAVILDVVFNQSDGLHPWYQMYQPSDNPFYNERAPHAYSVLNDWNQDNLLVRNQWLDMIKYWMTAYKVDGFRFDLVKGLGNNESYGDNASEYNTNRYNASRVAHMKQLTELMHSINPHSYSINENLATPEEENDMAANGQINWANINEEAGQYAMGYASGSDCNRFYAPMDYDRTWGSTVSYAESHDEQRIAYKQLQWGVSSIKTNIQMQMRRLSSMAAQMILTPGSHMIWQFGELGNATNTKNANGSNNTDPKPVLWSYLDNRYRRGLYDDYCSLIALRLNNKELFSKDATFTMNCSAADWTKGRTIVARRDGKELICVINPNTNSAPATFSGIPFSYSSTSDYEILAKSANTNPVFDAAKGTVTLVPGAFVVLGAGDFTGSVDDVISDNDSFTVSGNVIIGATDGVTDVYDLSGRKVSTVAAGDKTNLDSGIYIVRTAKGTPRKIAIR